MISEKKSKKASKMAEKFLRSLQLSPEDRPAMIYAYACMIELISPKLKELILKRKLDALRQKVQGEWDPNKRHALIGELINFEENPPKVSSSEFERALLNVGVGMFSKMMPLIDAYKKEYYNNVLPAEQARAHTPT